MTAATLGWDVGGANLKVAHRDAAGAVRVVERPFELWRDPARLAPQLAALARELPEAARVGVTMTAELADCFASKREGVAAVLDALAEALPAARLRIYGVDGRFRSADEARRDPLAVAAANWSATAHLVARTHPDALLLDMGSSTTDLIPLVGGRVAAAGRTDPERLRTGELVYTGALRTPIHALIRRVRLAAGPTRVAAEHFASVADAHLWLDHLPPGDYTCETADGRGISRPEVAARLARVVCADPEMLAPGDVDRIARAAAGAQQRLLIGAVRQVLARLGADAPAQAVVAGRGSSIAARAARTAGLPVRALGDDMALAAPAVAVATLLAEEAER